MCVHEYTYVCVYSSQKFNINLFIRLAPYSVQQYLYTKQQEIQEKIQKQKT